MEQADPIAAEQFQRSNFLRRMLLPLALLPAVIQPWAVLRFGVDVPFGDQWHPGVAGMYIKAHQGILTLADLTSQQNEYRMPVARIIYLALASLTHWNIIAEMLAEWLVVCVTSAGILYLLTRTLNRLPSSGQEPRRREISTSVLLVWFCCNILIFCPRQWENWLWGMGLANVLPIAFVVAALLVVDLRLAIWPKACVCAILCAAATYSFGNGLFAGPLVLFAFAWSDSWKHLKAKRSPLLLMAIVCAITIAFYFVNYRSTAAPESPDSYSAGLGFRIHYILLFLGGLASSAFRSTPDLAGTTFGTLQVLVLLGIIGYFLQARIVQQNADLCRRMVPWITIAGSSLLSAAVASIGRAGFGLNQAISSRYVTFSLYMLVALIVLLYMMCDDLCLRPRLAHRPIIRKCLKWASPLFAVIVVGIIAIQFPSSIGDMALIRSARRQAKAILLLINVVPDRQLLSKHLAPDAMHVLGHAESLNEMGYFRPALISTKDAALLSDPSEIVAGRIDGEMRLADGQIAIRGWAIFPHKSIPADGVVLTADDPNGRPIIFAVAQMGLARDDVLEISDQTYIGGGWMAIFPAPSSKVTIRAWAVDADTGKIAPLQGEATLN